MLGKKFRGTVTNVCKQERMLLLNAVIDGKTISVVSVYAPNDAKSRVQFLTSTERFVRENCGDINSVIIGGDLNTVDMEIDRKSGNLDGSSKQFSQFKKSMHVTDIWRKANPGNVEFTYGTNPQNMSRIDYLLCTNEFARRVTDVCITSAPVPDHQAVKAEFSLQDRRRGRGYWKLNISVLKDKQYCRSVSNIIKSTIAEFSNVQIHKRYTWDLIKIRIKEYSIKFCVAKKRMKCDRISEIEGKLNEINIDVSNDNHTEECLVEKHALKLELDSLLLEKARGAQVRSRAHWIEEGEKSTSYFLQLEKKHQHFNRIDSLRDGNVSHDNDDDILTHARSFYQDLYKTKNPNPDNIRQYLNSIQFNKTLSEEKKVVCEGLITKEECFDAVKTLKKNKSPGLDGLPSEFYQTFWPDISDLLVNVFNESFKEGKLSPSQNESVLSLIFKKGDTNLIQNYRPISLTNCDYKILAFALANRLHKVLAEIIDPDQNGYVKGRFIGYNLRLIQDIMEYAERTKNEGVLMLIDFKKAFDSVEWEYMFQTLNKFNFGPNFIAWIKTLYACPTSVIKNNGWFSNEFSVSRGIRQGCPISALLFILVVETLGLKLRQNKNLNGITIPTTSGNKTVLTQQYADDTCLTLKNQKEIPKALHILAEFGEHAGLELNLTKTEVMFLNCNSIERGNEAFGLKWTKGPVKCLGIYIGHNKKACIELNWNDKIKKMEVTLNSWKKRDLTLMGKILIIKTLAISQIVYSAINTPTPPGIIKQIDSTIFAFLWGERDRIKRKVLYAPIEQGGLNMLDVASQMEALKASWINRLILDNGLANWSLFGNKCIKRLGGKYVCCNFRFSSLDQMPILNDIPEFYRQVVLAYAKAKFYCIDTTIPVSKQEVLNTPLWGNINLQIKRTKKCLFFPKWIECGIKSVEDIKIVNRQVDTAYLFNKVKCHQNLFYEIFHIKNVLESLISCIDRNSPDVNDHLLDAQPLLLIPKSNIYKSLVKPRTQKAWTEHKWETELQSPDIPWSNVYIHKIKRIADKKIAEFNFKTLHFILPCNKHLKRWKIVEHDHCDVCGEVQDIQHLLFSCKRNVNIWEILDTFFNTRLTVKDIIIGRQSVMFDSIISLVSFILYKEWIICSNEDVRRTGKDVRYFMKHELNFRKDVYRKLGMNDISGMLEKIIERL